VEIPRPIGDKGAHCAEREVGEVAVRHVAMLGAEQKARHDGDLGVTEDDHCTGTHRTAHRLRASHVHTLVIVIFIAPPRSAYMRLRQYIALLLIYRAVFFKKRQDNSLLKYNVL